MQNHYNFLDFQSVNFRIPWPEIDIQTAKGKEMLTIENPVNNSKIEYAWGDNEMKPFDGYIEVKNNERLTLILTLKSGRKSPKFNYDL